MAPFLCLEIAHVPWRFLSQSTKLMRAVSVVDVERVDPFVGARASPLDMAPYNLQVCWKAVSSFLRHIWISERMSRRLFTRLVVVDGAKLCLSTACTNSSVFVSSGGDSECNLDSCASVWSVSRLRRTEVSSSTIHSLLSAALLSSLGGTLVTTRRYWRTTRSILLEKLFKRAILGV